MATCCCGRMTGFAAGGFLQGSKRILLVAFGENKAGIVRRAVEGAVSEECAASFLQDHPDVTVFLDSAAAAGKACTPPPYQQTGQTLLTLEGGGNSCWHVAAWCDRLCLTGLAPLQA